MAVDEDHDPQSVHTRSIVERERIRRGPVMLRGRSGFELMVMRMIFGVLSSDKTR